MRFTVGAMTKSIMSRNTKADTATFSSIHSLISVRALSGRNWLARNKAIDPKPMN